MLFEQHVALPSFTFISSYTKMSYCDVNMLVMGVSNTSIQDFNNLVGNGSRSQDLSWEERNNFSTWPPVSPNNRLNYQHVITSVPISELKTDLSPIKVEETGPWYE